jgi:deazaflavin-dependent oxidoreductase (nitroreductase family)
LFAHLAHLILAFVELKDGSSLVAHLTTTGRKSGLPRTVELRFSYFQGHFYASSSRVEGKHWCRNMMQQPAVELNLNGERIPCVATLVTDESLRRRILTMRDSQPRLERVVFQITPRP